MTRSYLMPILAVAWLSVGADHPDRSAVAQDAPYAQGRESRFREKAVAEGAPARVKVPLALPSAWEAALEEEKAPAAPIPPDATHPIPKKPATDGDAASEAITERYEDGRVKIVRHVARDADHNYINHGPFKLWDSQGRMVATGTFHYGKRHGEWVRLHVSRAEAERIAGKLAGEFSLPFASSVLFDKDLLNGTWKIIDARQQPIRSWSFDDGQLHGTALAWYGNGRQQREAHYRHGVLHGTLQQWGRNGERLSSRQYRDGRTTYPYVNKYATGEKEIEGQLLGAEHAGQIRVSWWDGIVRTGARRAKGRPCKHGNWTRWYRNGRKMVEGEFEMGLPVGKHTWWYPNRQKMAEGEYKDGREHGRWTYWHTNGQRKHEGHFVMGVEAGTWITWDRRGKVREVQEHELTGSPTPSSTAAAVPPLPERASQGVAEQLLFQYQPPKLPKSSTEFPLTIPRGPTMRFD